MSLRGTFGLLIAIHGLTSAMAAQATCPDVTGDWTCLRDTPHDGSERSDLRLNVTPDSNGTPVIQQLDANGQVQRSYTADGTWRSVSTQRHYRYTCGSGGIPLRSEFTSDPNDPFGAGKFLGASEWYPVPATNPTHLFLRSTCPSCPSSYPQWFGYICRRQ